MNSNEKLNHLLALIVKTAPEEIDCEEVMFRLAAFVELKSKDLSLSSTDFESLKQHLSVCHECQEELDLLEQLVDPASD